MLRPRLSGAPCWRRDRVRRPVSAFPSSRSPVAAAFDKADGRVWLDRTVGYWRKLMAEAASIEVPCAKATEALRAAHVCQMLVSDHGVLHGGEGFYDEFYIRDGAYQVLELEEAGLFDAARNTMAAYLRAQTTGWPI